MCERGIPRSHTDPEVLAMQKQRQRMMKRFAERARREQVASAQRTQRSKAIMAAFERRRILFVCLFLALFLVPVVFTMAPREMWSSWAFLALAVLLVWIGPFVLRYVVWR